MTDSIYNTALLVGLKIIPSQCIVIKLIKICPDGLKDN